MATNSSFKLSQNSFTILYITNAIYSPTYQHVWYKNKGFSPHGTTGSATEETVCKVSNPPLLVGQDTVKAVVTAKNMFISYFKFYRFAITVPAIYEDYGVYTEVGDAKYNLGNNYANYPAPYGTTSDVWSKSYIPIQNEPWTIR